jgi:chromatin remodeling complex protein RSC6
VPVVSTPAPQKIESLDASVAAADAAKEKKAAKKVLAKKSEEVASTSSVAAVSEPVPVPAPLASDVAPLDDSTPTPSLLSAKFTEFGAKLQHSIGLLNALKSEYKSLAKVVEKNQRLAQKKISQKKKASSTRLPSGFAKPSKITTELTTFLGLPVGTMIARTEVSKEINKYIKANNLRNPDNGREIVPNAQLAQLLNVGVEDKLTYFNLQRYMKHHFIKSDSALAATA